MGKCTWTSRDIHSWIYNLKKREPAKQRKMTLMSKSIWELKNKLENLNYLIYNYKGVFIKGVN